MTRVYRAIVKTAEEWEFLANPPQTEPLVPDDRPHAHNTERRRLNRLMRLGEHLNIPVGIVVEIVEVPG